MGDWLTPKTGVTAFPGELEVLSERRRHRRFSLTALVQTHFGTYYMKDVSAGGTCIVGSSRMKEQVRMYDTLEFDIHTTHGETPSRPVSLHCRGEVIRISDPSPYITEVAIRFEELLVME
jgi:hypothetical protein